MAHIPVEQVMVPRYGERRVPHESRPDSQAWIVNSRRENGRNFRLWMRPEPYDDLHAMYPHLPNPEDITRSGGFLHGRPMLEKAITLDTYGGPGICRKIFRVVHDGQPFGGVKARGYGTVPIDPLYFQILFQKHHNWNCRNPSPFISVTDSLKTATIIGAVYEARGHTGIKVLVFDTCHSAWNHKKQRLWNVKYLVDKFNTSVLGSRGYLERRFLVENYIPPECIIESLLWIEARDTLDPEGLVRHQMRRKIVDQSTRKRKREQDAEGLGVDEAVEGNQKDGTGIAINEDEEEVVPTKRPRVKRATCFKLRL
ncbi:hypothetical protein F5Y13DRAFT_194165 [Hypoxylon sp. FL1857]|nr:hypothetical protein F5Y13DRAFT_194165 [Hypoxylon sp. FL1857]